MKTVIKWMSILLVNLFCFIGMASAKTIGKGNTLDLECNTPVTEDFYGVARLTLKLGEETACILTIDYAAMGLAGPAGNKIAIDLQFTNSPSIKITPEQGITDKDGRIQFTITAINKGTDWVSWAIANEKGGFEFSKQAYDNGRAWGLFFEVK